VRPSGATCSVGNDENSITALVARLRPLGPTLIVMVCPAAVDVVNLG